MTPDGLIKQIDLACAAIQKRYELSAPAMVRAFDERVPTMVWSTLRWEKYDEADKKRVLAHMQTKRTAFVNLEAERKAERESSGFSGRWK